MSSASRPVLTVEVPQDGAAAQSSASSGSGRPESKWGRMLQSPSLFVERTASFTAKLAGGFAGGKSKGVAAMRSHRASVNPRQRAAQDAEYRTVLSLTQAQKEEAEARDGGRGGSGRDAVREIHFAPQQAHGPAHANIHETNRVVTSKYNFVTFLPIFLFEMFSRVAYLYFLFQAALSWWSVVSPYSGVGSTAALLFVLAVAGVKAIWEDVKRHHEDQRMNTSITHLLNGDGSVTDILWTDVRVGDAIVVRDDENFPADLLCLRSALPDNVCFIRTTNLDGETNLKIRKPLDIKGLRLASMADVMHLDLTLKAEAPNKNLHKFRGKAVVRDEAYASMPLSPGSGRMVWEAAAGAPNGGAPPGGDDVAGPAAAATPSVEVAVTMNEMLLRGCTLKNSGEIVGLVVYTGKQTRIQMNSTKTPLKIGSFDRFLNLQITLVIAMQMAMCVFCAVANYVWVKRKGIHHPYLALDVPVEGIYTNGFVQLLINFLTFWILLSYLVPISLFVTLEIVKLAQGSVFINVDKDMKDPATSEYARCRNSNLNEDLGKVEYIFSDKTGTLTSNEMQLRRLSIKGEVFGTADFRLEDWPQLRGHDALRRFDRRLARAASAAKSTPAFNRLVASGGSQARLMAYHSSNPSTGTADSVGLHSRGVDLEAFDSGTDRGAAATVDDPAAAARAAVALGHHMVDFFNNLCICQSLILDEDPAGGLPRYQGPSPDEVALVDAARQMGFEFKSRAQTSVTLSVLGREVCYEMLNVMEYSSERGCMSVIARSPDGTVRLYCKGSDTKVMKKVRGSTDAALVAKTEDNLHTFAKAGLRTLVLASKVIPEEVYREWDVRYQEASRMFEGRDAAMDALGNEIERELEVIGVTAIEDKLQDGVPAAIKTLLEANIRVWMITGDKQETAVNIAVSCDLVRNVDEVIMLNVDEKAGDAAAQAGDLMQGCVRQLCEKYSESKGLPSPVSTIEEVDSAWREGELAVDGPTLTFLLADPALRRQLAQVAARCSGVVVSRSSPSQKAAIVRMMSEHEMSEAAGSATGILRWYRRYRQRLRGKMLAIGDGANDVAMIQTADVGIGIMGKEGRQAMNNSDYAISQFRFLVPLLLVHGNLSYYRLARLIKYSFYKNITFAFVMFYYQFYNGFSGQALVDSITAAVFNVAFTSLPILLFAVLDRPVKELHAFVRYPQLYDKRHCKSLTTVSFWKSGILQGVVHGAVSFFIPYYSIATSGKHNITDVYSLGRMTFVALLGSVTAEVALIARYWTWLFFWITLLSYVLVYPYIIAFPWAELGVGYYDPANVGVTGNVLSNPTFWFVILVCYVVTFGTRFAERTAEWVFRPHDTMILAELEALEKEGGLMAGMSSTTKGRLVALGTVPPSKSTVAIAPNADRGGNAERSVGTGEIERVDSADGMSSWDSGNATAAGPSGGGPSPDEGSVRGGARAAGQSVHGWDQLQPSNGKHEEARPHR